MTFNISKITCLFLLINVLSAQQDFQFIDNVPKEFEENYRKQRHEYNPLNLGNYWQYSSESGFLIEYIEKDTVVNDQRYFKKYDYRYHSAHDLRNFYTWERNDTTKFSSYMLDWEDLDEDGFTDDELLLDSLEIPNYHEYLSYRHTWKEHFYLNFPSPALIMDSSWVIIFNDTVMSRYVMYGNKFYDELFADKYGVILQQDEASSPIILTGAVIDSVQYGTIVRIEDNQSCIPCQFELGNNYPNPFNPETTIAFSIPEVSNVKLIVYNLQGQKIKTLVKGRLIAGHYDAVFNSNNLSSGVYFYSLQTAHNKITKRMLVIK